MKISVSLAQIDVAFADPEANLRKGERVLADAVRRKSDLVCFPEMWTTAFDLRGDLPRRAKVHEEFLKRVAALAKKYSLWIGG
ncbi:MAG: hypothetical protein NTV79_06480, partial [Candidatus Aureabacteria bacterium]|nr:hypothetical protein [Candidatus Auribacterota bacterium]